MPRHARQRREQASHGRLDARQARSSADRGREALRRGDLALAVSELTKAFEALHEPPVRAALVEASLRYGQALLREGRSTDALTHLTRAWQLEPDLPTLAQELGRAAWQSGALDVASSALGRLLEHTQGPTPVRLALALIRIRQGRPQDALALLAKLPDTPDRVGSPGPGHRTKEPPASSTVKTIDLDRIASLVQIAALAASRPGGTAKSCGTPGLGEEERRTLATLQDEHERIAGAFAAHAARLMGEYLTHTREAAARSMASAQPAVLCGERRELEQALSPAFEEVASKLRGLHESLMVRLDSPVWNRLAILAVHALLDRRDPEAARQALGTMPPTAPTGLKEALEAVALLAAADPSGALGTVSRSTGLPIAAVTALLDEVLAHSPGIALRPELAQVTRFLSARAGLSLHEWMGEAAFHQGDLDEAVRQWGSIARPTPRIHKALALALEGLGRDGEAIPHWKAYLEPWLAGGAGPEVPPWLGCAVSHLAGLYVQAERHLEARSLLARAACRLPASCDVLAARLALLLNAEETDDLEEAAEALEKAGPRLAKHWILVAQAYDTVDETDRALRAITHTVTSPSPPPAAVHLYEHLVEDRVNEHCEEGEHEEALRVLEEAARLRPPTVWRHHLEFVVRDEADLPGARECLARARSLAATDPGRTLAIVEDLIDRDYTDDARSFLDGIPSRPQMPLAEMTQLLACLVVTGDTRRYREWTDQTLATLPTPAERSVVLVLVATVLMGRHARPDLALSCLETAVQLRPEDPTLRSILAQARIAALSAPRARRPTGAGLVGRVLEHIRNMV